jgi:hypothetical protein
MIVAILKVLFLISFWRVGLLISIDQLLISQAIAQLLGLIYLFNKSKIFGTQFLRAKIYILSLKIIKKRLKEFIPYYLNTIVKRIRENAIIILFNPFVSKEIIGVYSLFIKLASFIFGLSRVLEAFFMNRKNLEAYKKDFDKHYLKIAVTLQFLYILVGFPYIKIMTHNFYVLHLIIQSFLIFPHIKFLLVRNQLLALYKNKEANLSELFYCVAVVICFIVIFLLNAFSVDSLLITFVLATLSLQFYLIFNQSSVNSYASIK